jgi:hypothetical protein
MIEITKEDHLKAMQKALDDPDIKRCIADLQQDIYARMPIVP